MGGEGNRILNWNFLRRLHPAGCISLVLFFFVIRTCGCFVYFRWLPPASDAAAAFGCCLLFYCNCYEREVTGMPARVWGVVMLWLWCVIRFASHPAIQAVSQSVSQSLSHSVDGMNTCVFSFKQLLGPQWWVPQWQWQKQTRCGICICIIYEFTYVFVAGSGSVSVSISWAPWAVYLSCEIMLHTPSNLEAQRKQKYAYKNKYKPPKRGKYCIVFGFYS